MVLFANLKVLFANLKVLFANLRNPSRREGGRPLPPIESLDGKTDLKSARGYKVEGGLPFSIQESGYRTDLFTLSA